jgi:tetratricopeptide (TPR) repeat protein
MNKQILICCLVFCHAISCKNDGNSGSHQLWSPTTVSPSLTVGASLQETRDSLTALYRLRPDSRFMEAFTRAGALLVPGGKTTASAQPEEDNWRILVDGQEIGRVRAYYPEYRELFDVLLTYSATLPGVGKLPAGNQKAIESSSLFPLERAVAQLLILDEAWRQAPSSSTLIQSAGAIAALHFQVRDDFDVADSLSAHALALVALATVIAPEQTVRARALLAESFNASNLSLELALKLPEGDPLAAYIFRDDETLRSIANQKGATPEAKFLWLKRLVSKDDHVQEASSRVKFFPDSQKSLSLMSLRFSLGKFRIAEMVHRSLPWLVLDIATSDTGKLVSDKITVETGSKDELSAVLSTIMVLKRMQPDDLLAALDAALDGPEDSASLYNASMLKLTWKAFAYTGLFRTAALNAGGLYSKSRTESDLRTHASARGKTSRAFYNWYELWYRSAFEMDQTATVINKLNNLPDAIKGTATFYIWKSVQKRSEWSDTKLPKVSRSAVLRMDSRLSDRSTLCFIARDALSDQVLLERLLTSIVHEAPTRYKGLELWHARLGSDKEALRAIADNPIFDADQRGGAVRELSRLRLATRDELLAHMQKLSEDFPGDWSIQEDYIEIMENLGEHEMVRSIASKWLRDYKDTPGLSRLRAQTKIARAFYKEGKFKEGLEAVNAAIPGGWSGTMKRRALLLSALGRTDEAVEQTRKAAQRYPNKPLWSALIAEAYWRSGDFKKAADELEKPLSRLNISDWSSTISEYFMSVFDDASKERISGAVEELTTRKIDPYAFTALADELSKNDRHMLAHTILASLKMDGQRKMDGIIRAAQELRRAKDKDTALEWLEGKIPTSDMNLFGMMVYNAEADFLLFEHIPDPTGKDDHSDFLWLLRAAATNRYPYLAEKYGDRVASHYEGDGYSYYHHIGRFLVGTVSLDALLALGNEPSKETELAYYAGLKAYQEKRYKDASDWFRVVVELGQAREGEYRWAATQLHRWKKKGKYLLTTKPEPSGAPRVDI